MMAIGRRWKARVCIQIKHLKLVHNVTRVEKVPVPPASELRELQVPLPSGCARVDHAESAEGVVVDITERTVTHLSQQPTGGRQHTQTLSHRLPSTHWANRLIHAQSISLRNGTLKQREVVQLPKGHHTVTAHSAMRITLTHHRPTSPILNQQLRAPRCCHHRRRRRRRAGVGGNLLRGQERAGRRGYESALRE
jgi:hypothetical protein